MCNGILHSSENEQIAAMSNNVETSCKHTEQIPSGLVALPLTWVHCWRHWCHTFLLPASFPQVPESPLPHPQSWSIIRTDLLEPCWCDLPMRKPTTWSLLLSRPLLDGPPDCEQAPLTPYTHILHFWASEKQPYRWVTSLTYWPQLPLTPHCVMLTSPQPYRALPQPRLGQFTPTSCCISDMPIITQNTKENPDPSLNTIRPRVYNEMYINTFFWALSCGISLERKISFATAH